MAENKEKKAEVMPEAAPLTRNGDYVAHDEPEAARQVEAYDGSQVTT